MILTTLLNIAIFQGIVLVIIILKSPLFKSNSNKFLAYAIFLLSLLLLNLVFEIVEIYNTIPFLRLIDNIEWTYLFLAFIFLFTVNQVKHPIKDSAKIRWLFVPFLYNFSINVFNDLDKVVGLYTLSETVNTIIEFLQFVQFFILPPFIIGVLIYTYSFIKFSKDEQEKKWIKILWSLISTIFISFILAILIRLFFTYDISYFMKFLALLITFLIHWTAYYGIFKYRLAKDKEGINALLKKKAISTIYKKLSLDTIHELKKNTNNLDSFTKDNPYFKKLESLCKDNKIYRKSALNREITANKLGISSGYLSQLINVITEKNFAQYINDYRVEAVKEMILDSDFDDYNLLSIGLEAGFTSKTTFYNAFKKSTGMTPNAYRKTHK